MLTVYQTLHEPIRSALDLADSLIIKYDHLAANYNGASSEGKQRNVDILLPEVADKIDRAEQ
jgi:hypothetical protein